MIMCAGVPCKISWRGLVVVGLLVLAALPGWTSGQQETEKPKPIAPVAVPPPVQEPPAPTPAPAIAEVPPLPASPGIAVDYGYPIAASEPGDQDARLKAIEAQLQFLLKEVQGMRKAPGSKERGVRSSTPPPVRYVPNTPSIIAPVPPVGVRGQNASGEINLTRAIYDLSAAKAKALSELLQDSKGPVVEIKAEGDKVIVTTTPEAQQMIGQLIAMLQGKARVHVPRTTFQYQAVPVTTYEAVPAAR